MATGKVFTLPYISSLTNDEMIPVFEMLIFLCFVYSRQSSSSSSSSNETCKENKNKVNAPKKKRRTKVGKSFYVRPIQKLDPCRFCGLVVTEHGLFGLRAHEREDHPEKFIHLCPHPNCGGSYAEVNELLTCQESHKKKTNSQGQGDLKCFVCNET